MFCTQCSSGPGVKEKVLLKLFSPVNHIMQRSLKPQAVSAFVACLMLFLFSAQALSGTITSWGWDVDNQVTNTPLDTNFTAIAGSGYHSLALKSDGSLISWGYDGYNQVTNTPLGTDFTAIAGGGYHSLALTSDSVAVVPEPSSIAMFGIGALGLFGYSRRRRQTSAAA